jgi:hypothetical protein
MDTASDTHNEGAALLQHSNGISNTAARPNGYRHRVFVRAWLVLIVLIAIPLFLFTKHPSSWTGGGGLPPDPLDAADVILSGAPIIVCPMFSRNAPPYGPRFSGLMDFSYRWL